MNNPYPHQQLTSALANSESGVIGLVNELLAVAQERDLTLDWQAGQCRVSFLNGGESNWVEAALPKSVVRAVLARLAALCNELLPNSVSPYGGVGEVRVSGQARPIRVAFTNTPEKQVLELALQRLEPPQPVDGRPMAAAVDARP